MWAEQGRIHCLHRVRAGGPAEAMGLWLTILFNLMPRLEAALPLHADNHTGVGVGAVHAPGPTHAWNPSMARERTSPESPDPLLSLGF